MQPGRAAVAILLTNFNSGTWWKKQARVRRFFFLFLLFFWIIFFLFFFLPSFLLLNNHRQDFPVLRIILVVVVNAIITAYTDKLRHYLHQWQQVLDQSILTSFNLSILHLKTGQQNKKLTDANCGHCKRALDILPSIFLQPLTRPLQTITLPLVDRRGS